MVLAAITTSPAFALIAAPVIIAAVWVGRRYRLDAPENREKYDTGRIVGIAIIAMVALLIMVPIVWAIIH